MKRRFAFVPKSLRPADVRDESGEPGALRYADAAALLLLLALTVVAQWGLLRGGTIVGIDSATQFYPWYSYLGESLRSGEIPGWNPHLLSGAPFAGDPLSGWTYLPAMILFTLMPLTAAAKTYMFLHPLLAGLFTYALARTLRISVAGSLLAAVAYAFSGYLYVHNIWWFAYASVVTWLPLAILGAELAIQSHRWLDRGLWWGISGLALSQILASWLGQGSYYALLALGGYVAYRTLVSPPGPTRGVGHRLFWLFLHGGGVLAFGFGLAAAGVLPRLEYNALSNLAGGYDEPSSGWTLDDWQTLLVVPDLNYIGATVLALALVAPLVVRWRYAAPYFAALALCALTLSGQGLTLLHSALYLLPRFEQLHQHVPQRVMVVFYLAVVLLAGATLTGLGERGWKTPYLAVLPVLAAIFLVTRSTLVPPLEMPENGAEPGLWERSMPVLLQNGIPIPPGAFFVLIFVLLLATAYALLPPQQVALRGIVAVLVVLAVFVDQLGADTTSLEKYADSGPKGRIMKTDLEAYYAPTGVTRFLQARGEEPFRYTGYAPQVAYNAGFTYPRIRALEAENRAMLRDGSYSVQGYNAVHLARYGEYFEVMNGQSQNYHGANVLEGGFDSPLLDLLNVRYITVPAGIRAPGLDRLEREHRTVYEGHGVEVLENERALPRAWIVHSAREVNATKALTLLDSGAVDPAKTALLERQPPPLAEPEDPAGDQASVTSYEANTIKLQTSTGAKGLLVLSEVYYPAWKAYVDGEPVSLFTANQLLRAVPVPAGEHTVELRYESWTLRLGVAISLLTGVALAALVVVRIRRPAPDGLPYQRTRREDP
ncbi:MAG: YfhO family protein [Rubrobacter sp.]